MAASAESFSRLYKRGDAKWRVFFWVAQIDLAPARAIGNAISLHTPTPEVQLKSVSRLLLCGAAISAVSLAACGRDVITATPESLSGAYTAAVFTTTPSGGQTTDQKALGGFINITLNDDHTTTGQLHVAASNGSPAFDGNMAGTWSIIGTEVRFVQAADTFMRNMVFNVASATGVSGTSLIGDFTTGGTRIQVTLVKPAH
jgi:hypothetical protein